MSKLKLTVIAATLLLLGSCTTQKRCFNKFPPPPPSTNVEVKEVVKYKDTTIYVYLPADTVQKTDTIIIGVDGQVNYPLQRLDVEYAYATFQIKNSKLDFKLFQKESAIAQTIENAIKESSKTEVTVIKEPYPVPQKISWWQQTKMNLGIVFIVIVIIFIGYQILKLKKFI